MNPLISVVVPLYNRVDVIKETVASVQGQTYPHWELIVVDDGSTDGSDGVVKALAEQDKRIKFYRRDRQPNGGSACRNIGFEKSTGSYVIFLDSDDVLAPFCLEHRLEHFAQYPDKDCLVFPPAIFSTTPEEAYRLWNRLVKPNEMSDLDRFLATDAPWQTSGPIWKREALLRVGPWMEGIRCRQDLEFHVRALIMGINYRKFPEVYDYFYRRSPKGAQISKGDFVDEDYIRSKNYVFGKLGEYLVREGKLDFFRTQMMCSYYLETGLGNYQYNHRIPLGEFVGPISRLKLLPFTDKARSIVFLGVLYLLRALVGVRYSMFLFNRRFRALPSFFLYTRYDREVKLTDEDRRKYLQRLNRSTPARTP